MEKVTKVHMSQIYDESKNIDQICGGVIDNYRLVCIERVNIYLTCSVLPRYFSAIEVLIRCIIVKGCDM